MKIQHLLVNRIKNPIGFDLNQVMFSYVVEEAKGKHQKVARIEVAKDRDFKKLIFDSGDRQDIKSTGFLLPDEIELENECRYFWRVSVKDETGDFAQSREAFFETGKGKEWIADFISPVADRHMQAVLYKKICINKPVARARMYMTGLGLYEFYVNTKKQGEECLLPGFTNYDAWIQYQTFEITLKIGENLLEVALADGWYKGWYGLRQNHDNYGDRLACIGQLHIEYVDGSKEIIGTDTSWKARKSKAYESSIYLGEYFDDTLDTSESFATEVLQLDKSKLSPRLSPRIIINNRLKPIEVIHTPKGETVLDMGQNMVGWLEFLCKAPKGKEIYLQFGEIMQDGCFYRDNLRTSKAEFKYISDGNEKWVRQHFTFYGFRFINVVGWEGEINLQDFTGLVIHSEMEEIGYLRTSNKLVNRLIENTKWGMKGNFLDIPTDCPQRDERCGWTGDAQIFSGTASFTMDTAAFYTKFGKDIYSEQLSHGGSVPDTVPQCHNVGDGSAAWGDAATIIPWNVYLHFGDISILQRQYQSMKDWVEYIKSDDEKNSRKRLWLSGFQYGDWLALDGNYPGGVYGATDPGYIASAYYYYSTSITAKTAKILGQKEDADKYERLANEIKKAFIREYFTPAGKLAVDTMTAHVVAICFDLTPDFAKEKVKEGLLYLLRKSRYHLTTGFVGTPYLCRALSEVGLNDIAYHLLLEEGYPGWLYEVLMGATTIWERWNSVEPDGKISGTEMNSLNHYAYGSIVEWMYRYMAGISPNENYGGFKHFTIAPKPNYQIPEVECRLNSASGNIVSKTLIENGRVTISVEIPFDTSARLVLPDANTKEMEELLTNRTDIKKWEMQGNDANLILESGSYDFTYFPAVPYRKVYSENSPMEELEKNPKTKKILDEQYFPLVGQIPFEKELYTLQELMNGPFTGVSHEQQRKIDKLLRAVE